MGVGYCVTAAKILTNIGSRGRDTEVNEIRLCPEPRADRNMCALSKWHGCAVWCAPPFILEMQLGMWNWELGRLLQREGSRSGPKGLLSTDSHGLLCLCSL